MQDMKELPAMGTSTRTLPEYRDYREPDFANEGECFTDVGNGERLALNCHGAIGYAPEWGWLVYHQGAWRRDAGEAGVTEQAKGVLRGMTLAHVDAASKADRDQWHRHIRYSFNHVPQMVHAARAIPGIAATVADFDSDPWLLNVQNGTLDLRTGQCRAHDPAQRLTKQAQVTYDPTATAPTWERFLDDIFLGDTDLSGWVQRALGYSLTGDMREQAFFLCYGSGANGKSTFLEAVRGVVGDYGAPLKADALMDAAFRGNGADPELAALVGARYVTAQEPHERGRPTQPTSADSHEWECKP